MVQVDARGIFLQIDLLWDGVRGRPTRRAPSAVMCNGPKAPMQPYGTCTGTEAQVFGARKQTTRVRRDHILSLSSCPFAGLSAYTQGEYGMRQVTLAATTLATLAFASAAYADSNYGPRHNGNQCWHNQGSNSMGYWTPCQPSQSAQGVPTRAPASANNATRR